MYVYVYVCLLLGSKHALMRTTLVTCAAACPGLVLSAREGRRRRAAAMSEDDKDVDVESDDVPEVGVEATAGALEIVSALVVYVGRRRGCVLVYLQQCVRGMSRLSGAE